MDTLDKGAVAAPLSYDLDVFIFGEPQREKLQAVLRAAGDKHPDFCGHFSLCSLSHIDIFYDYSQLKALNSNCQQKNVKISH